MGLEQLGFGKNPWLTVTLALGLVAVTTLGVGWFSSTVPSELGTRAKLALLGEQWSDSWRQFLPSLSSDAALQPEGGWSVEAIRTEYATLMATLPQLQTLSLEEKNQLSHRWETLQRLAPGLKPFIRLHRSEVYAAIPNEAAAQYQLVALIAENTPLSTEAQYRLGQSHLRASEWDKAQHVFDALETQSPQSDQGIAAHYYLGTMAAQQGKDPSPHWHNYLTQSPTGRFANDCAHQWLATAQSKNIPLKPADKPWIATGLLQGKDALASATEALAVLAGASPSAEAYAAAGIAYQQLHQTPQALASFQRALMANPSESVMPTLMAALSKAGSLTQQEAVLKASWQQTGSALTAGDAVLWRLSLLNESQASVWLSQLVNTYPQSRYAPEATWQLWWKQWLAARRTGQIPAQLTQQAETFLQTHPTAKASASMAFWLAKSYEAGQGDPIQGDKAKATYTRITKDYPWTYYAFRAQQRLNALSGQPDAGWQLQKTPNFKDIHTLPLVPFSPSLEELSLHGRQAVEALISITQQTKQPVVLDDAQLWLKGMPESPQTQRTQAVLEAWQAQWQQQPAHAIQAVREALQNIASESKDLSAYQPNPTELGILYPTPYTQLLAAEAQRSGISPWQSLGILREESHFNPQATSSSNALGLMQLLPTTAAEVAGWEKLLWGGASSLYLPETNIRLGSRYLAYLNSRFETFGPVLSPMLAVGAYNGGPNAMARWATQNPATQPWLKADPDVFVEQIPYEQTRTYIKKVFGSIWAYQALSQPH
ncbi:MAG: transglycosylase SLT domain-containing protein [Vampirovibrionales bacterium]|nr:transglycosylase SLT domain-containing protein [Vampirovibrionales bacterium]